jgi:hypothetical protein
MSRHLLLLLLATGMALAGDGAKTENSASTAGTQKTTYTIQSAVQTTAEIAREQSEVAQAPTREGATLVSVPGGKALGMSILGNQDAPKSLVIVPWKSSELGDTPGVSTMLDDSRQPVDKEVFMRALRYYEIRSGTKK